MVAGRIGSSVVHTALLATLLGAFAPLAAQPTLPGRADLQLQPSARRDPKQMKHLDYVLRDLALNWSRDLGKAREKAAKRGLRFADDRVLITLDFASTADAEHAVPLLAAADGLISAKYRHVLDAWMPPAALRGLSSIHGLRLAYRPLAPVPLAKAANSGLAPSVGSHVTQGVAASNADEWHLSGHLGTGKTIAIIDSFQGLSTAITEGELPDPIFCFPSCAVIDVSSDHGTACAEIAHDMAPGAALVLSSASTPTEFAELVVDLAAAGADVISVSQAYIHPTPGDGTGIMADAIREAEESNDSLYVGAAGNHALAHWDKAWTDSNENDFGEFATAVEVNVLYDGNPIPSGFPITAYLRWNRWPTTNQDFDLYLLFWTGSGWTTVDIADNPQTGSQPPFEVLSVQAPTTGIYGLAIFNFAATASPAMDLMSFSQLPLSEHQAARSLLEPATSPYSFSVAAVDVSDFSLEPYSSRGPNHGPGGSLTGGLQQPRIAAFANVDTLTDNAFNGTSAAAPHVAGAAALVRGAFPLLSAFSTQLFLESEAVDQGAAGYDSSFGAGRLWLGAPPEPQELIFASGFELGNLTDWITTG